MSDKLILIATFLFILSLISERIANFFKLYLPEDRWFFFIPPGKFRTKQDNDYEEKCRARRVFVLALLSGFGVALVLKADVIAIFNSGRDPESTLGWDTFSLPKVANYKIFWQNFGSILITISGCLLTGFFLSFGSKFWHDLLDLLLEVKNLRKKLVDEKTYQIDSTAKLIAHLAVTEGEIISKAFDENYDALRSIEGVTAIGKKTINVNGEKKNCIQVNVDSLETKNKIKPYLSVKFGTELYEAPLNVIVSGNAIAESSSPGERIRNRGKKSGGTFGCVVKDLLTNEEYILTCYHVLRVSHKWRWFNPTGDEAILDENNKEIASLSTGFRDNYFDVGLAKCMTPIINIIASGIGKPKAIRPLSPLDEALETPVKLKGMTNNSIKVGVIYNDCINVKLKYSDGRWELKELFSITKRVNGHFQSITTSGDSGSIVLDSNNYVIGMIVGGDDKFSYAIPMNKIADRLGIDLA